MQFKKISLIAGAIAISLVITPLTVKAETNISSPQIVAQIPQLPFLESLGLTESQKAQISEIGQNTRGEIEQILTPAKTTVPNHYCQ